MTLNRWDPLKDLLNFHEKVNRLMHLDPRERAPRRQVAWKPVVDVLETPEAYIVRVDLPGVGKDNIKIEIQGDRLTIQGERPVDDEPRMAAYHSIERETGIFERSFNLPGDVDADTAEARYLDGVLDIVLPKAQQYRERSITVVFPV